jgi:putative restriction endonuclease
VDAVDRDRSVRLFAFDWLRQKIDMHGEVLPRALLQQGFEFDDVRVPLVGPQGIFKPAVMDAGMPLSITSVPIVKGKDRPYEDDVTEDGLLLYRYRGTDILHHENVGLRRALTTQTPLIYFHGIAPGQYLPQFPVFLVADYPASLSFTVAVDDPQALRPDLTVDSAEEARRRYVTRLARHRLHQLAFRHRVLRAYRQACAICSLRHAELLDAAHILPDGHPRGHPVVPNGLALCKLHHAAFDRHIVGIRPDLVVEVRQDSLSEVDGPMLLHGLQGFESRALMVVPRSAAERPNPEFLRERYELFQRAG